MNDIPRQKLIEIIAQYGSAIIDEPRRVEGLLKDLCGECKREINTLMDAARERVPQDLRDANPSLPPEMLVNGLVQRLLGNRPMSDEMARWAVESWAAALGVPVQPALNAAAEEETRRAAEAYAAELARLEAQRRAAEARAAELARLEAQRRAAEAQAAEQARLEEARRAAEAQAAEQARQEEARRVAEAHAAEQARVEAQRRAAEAYAAEQARREEERRAAEAYAAEQARREEQRRAAEALAAQQALHPWPLRENHIPPPPPAARDKISRRQFLWISGGVLGVGLCSLAAYAAKGSLFAAPAVLATDQPAVAPTVPPAPTAVPPTSAPQAAATKAPSAVPATATTAPSAVPATAAPAPTAAPTAILSVADVVKALPRSETLYFNGLQWGSIQGWNPYSFNMNNALGVAQGASARVVVFETPYIYNMLDGKQVPLLADGDYIWNDRRTQITFKLKAAARWNDGTPVTADDVAYTWTTNLKYQTNVGNEYTDYIDSIVAVDRQTVMVKARLDKDGKTVNPLQVSAYLSNNYVIQKAWTQTLEKRAKDAAAFRADPAEDFVASGPYRKFFADDQKVIYIRNDNYWGQHPFMWGKLPPPKYLAHVIYKDNDAGFIALKAGQVDVSQQFNANVQDLWLKDKLPISTYMDKAPYSICASLPTAYFNLSKPGLNNVVVRKAIAMAVDYNTISANAMTNQSPTFQDVPRSLMNPTAGEQALYDHAAVQSLQWAGNDVEGAKKLLDDAGIKAGADGWRTLNGRKLSFNACSPNGWSDWQAAMEIVAAAGKKIGIQITTFSPEWGNYQTVFINGNQTEYDIFMVWTNGAGPTNPWGRVRQLMSSEFAGTMNNWNGNWGGYRNARVDEIIKAIPGETDPTRLKALYTEATRIYLTDVPSFSLMYRPDQFHTVNESVWTGYPRATDGNNIPPMLLTDGYGIAGLYNISLVKK